MTDRFFDTNVLLYLLSADEAKANRAEALLAQGGTISVQVLNEFTSVASRKLGLSLDEIHDILATLRAICPVVPLTLDIHDHALRLAQRYGFAFYDALIVSAALAAKCDQLISEDFQDGQVIEDTLHVENPFKISAPE